VSKHGILSVHLQNSQENVDCSQPSPCLFWKFLKLDKNIREGDLSMSWLKNFFNSIFSNQLKLLGILSALLASVFSSIIFFQQNPKSIFKDFSWNSLSKLSAFNYGQILIYFMYLSIGLIGFFFICLPVGFGIYWLIYKEKLSIIANRNRAIMKSQLKELEKNFEEIEDIAESGKFAEAAKSIAKSQLLTGKSIKEIKLELANLAQNAMNSGEYEDAIKIYESALQIEDNTPILTNKVEILISKLKSYLAGYGFGAVASITLMFIGFFSILLLPLILGILMFSIIFAFLFFLFD